MYMSEVTYLFRRTEEAVQTEIYKVKGNKSVHQQLGRKRECVCMKERERCIHECNRGSSSCLLSALPVSSSASRVILVLRP